MVHAGTVPTPWRFTLAWALPVLVVLHAWQSPHTVGLGTVLIWFAVALADHFWPGARRSPPAGPSTGLHRVVLLAHVPLQLVMLALVAQVAHSTGATHGWGTVLALGFAAGWVSGSLGITFAHELGHHRSRLDRALAWVLMTSVCYSHFMVEHYRGHHPRAATSDDPATARDGESLYRFLPRTLLGSWLSAWRLEAARIRQAGQGGRRGSWLGSPLLWTQLLGWAWLAALAWLDARVAVFWLTQSAVAVLLLEAVNYIEHYGLQRQVHQGRREPFGRDHAWNADHAISNALLVNLQRHSDHHMHAFKPYAELGDMPQAPRLPTGYAGCLLLALVPPLWFAVMHPRLREVRQRAGAAAAQEPGLSLPLS